MTNTEQREWLEWAEQESNRQRKIILESEIKQRQIQANINAETQLFIAMNNYYVMCLWYSALK